MDAKITKQRLSRMLSYDWVKMVVVAAAIIMAWVLIFTMTATRITPAQQYSVFNYKGNRSWQFTDFNDAYNDAYKRDIFSHEVLDATTYDLSTVGSDMHTVLQSRLETDEGDAIFVSKEYDTSTAYETEDGEVEYAYTYLETFIVRYGYYLYDINEYIAYMQSYLNGYFVGGYAEGTLDEVKVEVDFRAREKKDKRFKTEKQKKAGILKDIERMYKYRDALVQFEAYLESGIIALEYTTIIGENEDGEQETWVDNVAYSINLCPNEDTMGGLKKYASYLKTVVNDEGKEQKVVSAENMQLCLFKLGGVNKNFVGENLIFINEMVDLSLKATAAEKA